MIAYFDTASGIAGDMTLAALVDAGADADYLQTQIASLGMPGVSLRFSETYRHCFRALRLDVEHPPENVHRHLSDIEGMIAASSLTTRETSLALRMFRKIGQAEARVHGTTLEEVHFHEVGAVDSIVDIVGVAVALSSLGIDRIIASPTPTGCGTIHIAHGPVSVPAPATAELLKGIPVRGSDIAFELTTPTGAAVLATLVDGFGPLPSMTIQSVGFGAGHKDLAEQANVLRIILGHSVSGSAPAAIRDEVVLLETNLDDASGERIGYAIEQLWKSQPLDVYTTPIGMKKNRPGVMLSVIAKPEQQDALEMQILRLTGSLGVRTRPMSRRIAPRDSLSVATEMGTARVKVAWQFSDRVEPSAQLSPEFEDCRALADASGNSLDAVFQAVTAAAHARLGELSPPELLGQDSASSALGQADSRVWPKDPHAPAPSSHDHSAHDHDGHDHHHH